jgi:ankyrin repeat protein
MARNAILREAKDRIGRNALHFAAGKGHLDVCRFLVEELGLDVNSAAGSACESCALGEVPVSLTLLPCRWNAGSLRRGQRRRESPGVPARPWRRPRVPDAKGSTPLHDAAEQGAL